MNKIAAKFCIRFVIILLLVYLLTYHTNGSIQYVYANF